MHVLFADIRPYKTGFFDTGDGHKIYYEQTGNPDGIPVLFIHGGPGAGTDPSHRCFFDPEKYRIILFDQRGCGQSSPHANLKNNTTAHLIRDMEQLRETLGIKSWVLFGGSWGTTLALAYCIENSEAVLGMILRGIFLGTQKEMDWLYRDGANRIYPDYWQHFVEPIPQSERKDIVQAFYKRLTGDDEIARMNAAKHWSIWEGSCATLHFNHKLVEHFSEPHVAIGFAAIATHYFVNNCFLAKPLIDQLQTLQSQIEHIPTTIVHGRYDMVCALDSAYQLHEAMPQSQLKIIRDAGHSAFEPGTVDVLIRSTNEMLKSIREMEQ
jgi:proline iminopeptidase